mmetsp:Transcript_21675/g.60530  ORF Transcript_21675/g.60530 Transcript_21675/m.60530 type:complete len:234 (-) Transcript_21675:276-977(-)
MAICGRNFSNPMLRLPLRRGIRRSASTATFVRSSCAAASPGAGCTALISLADVRGLLPCSLAVATCSSSVVGSMGPKTTCTLGQSRRPSGSGACQLLGGRPRTFTRPRPRSSIMTAMARCASCSLAVSFMGATMVNLAIMAFWSCVSPKWAARHSPSGCAWRTCHLAATILRPSCRPVSLALTTQRATSSFSGATCMAYPRITSRFSTSRLTSGASHPSVATAPGLGILTARR